MVIDSNGEVVPALVEAATTSRPVVPECGWQATTGTGTIPLGHWTYDWPWAALYNWLPVVPELARHGVGGRTPTTWRT